MEFVSKLCGGSLPHERYKQIALDCFAAESKEEIETKSLADAYRFAISNVNQPLSKIIIQKAYYLLTESILEEDVASRILDCFYKNINNTPEQRIMSLQRKIIKLDINRRIELSFILSNLIMIKCDRNPLIPYTHLFESYKLNLKIDDSKKWLFLISQMEEKQKELSPSKIDLKTIIEIVKPKLDYLKNKFKVEFLGIYGSVVKGLTFQTSDIDFLVSFDSSLLDFERGQHNENLKIFLEELLDSEIDLIDFTHALKTLDISEMENLVVLIKAD